MPVVFCKTRPNPYSCRKIRMSGKARIEAALKEIASVFSNVLTVPRNSPFYSPYLVSKLTKLKAERSLYKIIEIDSKNKQYLNFGLRAAVLAVLNQTSKSENAATVMITFTLTEHYCRRLKSIDSTVVSRGNGKPPISALRADLKRTLFNKFSITHEFFVLERSRGGCFHAHILASLPCPELKTLKGVALTTTDTFNRLKLALKELDFVRSNSNNAIQIKDHYNCEVYRRVIGEEASEFIELDIDSLGDDSGWKIGKYFTDLSTGEITVVSYKSSRPLNIDTGIADYLSKELKRKIFRSSRDNYSISSAVRQELKVLAKEIIAYNRMKK